MNAARLLEHFERISDAADAVPRLRRFVLDLAVRGALVAPEAHDKPVSLADAKARAPQVKAVDLPIESLSFTVPAAWRWAYLTEFANVAYGFAFASNRFNSSRKGMPLIRIRDIANLDTEAYFDGDYDEQYIVRRGDYVVGMDGSFNVRRWRGSDSLLNQRVLRIKDWHPDALCAWCQIPLQMILDHVHGQTSQTTVKHLSAKQMNGVRIPLPPLAEQHRIVAKVDELMAVCDRLEAAQAEREARRDRLVSASLARVTNPDSDDAKSATPSVRFHLDHFARLATRPEHVKQLRQTILNLAVRGRLVPQFPHEETAEQMLEGVEAPPLPPRYNKRSQESVMGSCGLAINHPKAAAPPGWMWVPLIRIAKLESGHTPSRNRPDWWNGDVPWIGLVDARVHNNGVINTTIQSTNAEGLANSAARLLPAGTVCFSRTASVGYVVIMGRAMATSQDFVNWVPTPAVTSEWIQLVLMAERPALDRFSKGAVHQTIYYPAWISMHIALPPLAEQRRIVAKVEELMALCDQLEASLASAATDRARLLEALLHEALASAA
ncbi:MAG: restriction endonuclease subunit S [Planctomycetota bacterium]|nr:restriction endonuclease subunit S [Planctomycetota bacterium]